MNLFDLINLRQTAPGTPVPPSPSPPTATPPQALPSPSPQVAASPQAAASPVPLPVQVTTATGAPSSPVAFEPGQAVGFFTDSTICIGCKACEVACKQWNQLPANEGGASTLTGNSYDNTGELSATLSARVIEVLPNGDLALEGVREVDINGDIQILVLTGVVRTSDIRPGNIVPSTAVGQMRIRYFGRGLMRDNLKPGWIVRVLPTAA